MFYFYFNYYYIVSSRKFSKNKTITVIYSFYIIINNIFNSKYNKTVDIHILIHLPQKIIKPTKLKLLVVHQSYGGRSYL